MTEPVLKVSQLRVDLATRNILRGLTFDLQENETLVVIGPNGAGKTVLLKALIGLLPRGGNLRWRDGIKLGYVPQRISIQRDLPVTVADFFEMKAVSREKCMQSLSNVGIDEEEVVDAPLGTLSSGLLQRTLIAWALTREPDVLLLDEPTTGIDIGGEDTIHEFLHTFKRERNVAVILVTHDLSTVYAEADHVLCINRQRHCYGSPQDILRSSTLQEIYGREVKFFRQKP